MKIIAKYGLALLLLGVGMLVIAGTHMVSADSYKDITASAVGKDIFGQVIVTEKLTESWEYNGEKVTWHSSPTYTLSKAWWLAWGYYTGAHTGVKTTVPNKEYMAFGSAHYHAGIPAPWGAIGINQDIYLNLYFYCNGVWYQESGYAYET